MIKNYSLSFPQRNFRQLYNGMLFDYKDKLYVCIRMSGIGGREISGTGLIRGYCVSSRTLHAFEEDTLVHSVIGSAEMLLKDNMSTVNDKPVLVLAEGYTIQRLEWSHLPGGTTAVTGLYIRNGCGPCTEPLQKEIPFREIRSSELEAEMLEFAACPAPSY